MGSSGSKEASAAGAPKRAGFFRPACLRWPKVPREDRNGKEAGKAKDVGSSESTQQNQEDSNEGRCPNLMRSSSLRSSDNVVRLDRDVPGSPSTTFSNMRSVKQASTLRATHFHCCFGFSGNAKKSGSCENANASSSNHPHLVTRCNSTPLPQVRNCLDQALDSSSDAIDLQNPKDANGVAASEEAAASNADCNETECPRIPGSIERKLSQRRQEPVEGTARFSRTRSVGRLRDRVLRRSPCREGRFGFLFSEESSAYSRQDSRRRLLHALANISYTDSRGNDTQVASSTNQLSGNSNSLIRPRHQPETSESSRETSSHDAVEHDTTFFERRRRIRSQVRALQRLGSRFEGSRFENITGHERQCILSGQHRAGHCTCGISGRSRNPPDQTSTRASISRIVMLAEALFEVLDEIHQQAVVLASRPSTASLGSVPAPKEVVDRMPLKVYVKSQKRRNDEISQCYICLLEYEEGDEMRILPCLHEFHRSCVDKWLKEIHRVCPLCRYDVCSSDGSHASGVD